MESYYDSLIQELLGGGMPDTKRSGYRAAPIVGGGLPKGMSEVDLAQGMTGGGFDERTARRLASGAEDVMLSGHLGSKRKLGENESMPRGAYALAEYPGLQYDIWAASNGMPGRGAGAGSTVIPGSEEDLKLKELRKRWAEIQGSMMPQGNFVSRMGGR